MTALRKWLSMTFLPSSTSRVLALFFLLTCWRIENGKGFNINSLSDFAFCQTKATFLGTMVKYFNCAGFLKATWDQVSQAFWERYPNPYSNHVLTEDIIFREVTPDNCLISRRLLTKTSRAPRWAERFLPSHMARKAYIIEDSVVDPQKRSLVTFTWNISHARFMSVEERCVYTASLDNSNLTEIKREAWISSNLYGFSRAVQEFGLARFKSSVVKTMKGFEYVLARMQGETPTRTLAETATEKARETALAAKEKAKGLASQAQKKQYV